MSRHFTSRLPVFLNKGSLAVKLIAGGMLSIFILGCVAPKITTFTVTPRIFCPGTDIRVTWATEDVEAVEVSYNGAVIGSAINGSATARGTTSGTIELTARRENQTATIAQEVVLFSGRHAAELVTTGCSGDGIPTDTINLTTNDLALRVNSVASSSTPLTISHAGMTRQHPPASFDVWQGEQMSGSWTVTGTAQPGRSCRGTLGGTDGPNPVSVTVVGSCDGGPGDGPQSITPPDPVQLSDVVVTLLRCNGEPINRATRAHHLWIREPNGCVVDESFVASSFEEAVGCARDEAKNVVGSVAELHPGPTPFHVSCGSPNECFSFMAFNRADARNCALSLCPGSGGTFLDGRCEP